jgi:hypothetical protein
MRLRHAVRNGKKVPPSGSCGPMRLPPRQPSKAKGPPKLASHGPDVNMWQELERMRKKDRANFGKSWG